MLRDGVELETSLHAEWLHAELLIGRMAAVETPPFPRCSDPALNATCRSASSYRARFILELRNTPSTQNRGGSLRARSHIRGELAGVGAAIISSSPEFRAVNMNHRRRVPVTCNGGLFPAGEARSTSSGSRNEPRSAGIA